MASLRVARYAPAPRGHRSISLSPNPFHASLRPQLRNNAPCLSQRRLGARNFSIEAVLDGSVQVAYDFLIDFHKHGQSFVFPIIALAFATSIARFPLQLYSQHIRVRQAAVKHYVTAWHNVAKGNPLQVALKVSQERKRIMKEFKCQDWKAFAPALGIPLWLISSEAVRRLCGVQGGIVSLITGRYRDAANSASEVAASSSDQTTAAISTTAEGISTGAQSAVMNLDMGVYDSAGQLLFDLGAPDPYFIGPAVLAMTMMYTTFPRSEAYQKMVFNLSGTDMSTLSTRGKLQLRFSRAAFVASAVLPFAMCQLPSGLFIYWIASTWWTRIFELFGKAQFGFDPQERIRRVTVKPARFENWLLRRTY